jgi:hypothetical protein
MKSISTALFKGRLLLLAPIAYLECLPFWSKRCTMKSDAPLITCEWFLKEASQLTKPESLINFLILSRLPRADLSCARALIVQSLAASCHSSTDICLSIFGIGSKYHSLISRWQQQRSFNDSYTALILEDAKSSTLH